MEYDSSMVLPAADAAGAVIDKKPTSWAKSKPVEDASVGELLGVPAAVPAVSPYLKKRQRVSFTFEGSGTFTVAAIDVKVSPDRGSAVVVFPYDGEQTQFIPAVGSVFTFTWGKTSARAVFHGITAEIPELGVTTLGLILENH